MHERDFLLHPPLPAVAVDEGGRDAAVTTFQTMHCHGNDGSGLLWKGAPLSLLLHLELPQKTRNEHEAVIPDPPAAVHLKVVERAELEGVHLCDGQHGDQDNGGYGLVEGGVIGWTPPWVPGQS